MASSLTHEQRARRYLQASMSAGYAHQTPEAKQAAGELMAAHERAYSRVREHALAGADRDFDQALTPGEREHQRHLRTTEGLQEGDVQRIRNELRSNGQDGHRRAGTPRNRAKSGASAGPRAAQRAAAAGAGAAASVTGTGGNTFMYLIGVAIFLSLVYLLVAGKGTQAVTGIVHTFVGAAGTFIRAEPKNGLSADPLVAAEKAFGTSLGNTTTNSAGGTVETRAPGAPASPYAPAHGAALTGNKGQFAKALAGLTGLNSTVVNAWLNHEQGSSTVEGGNNWLNVETGGPGGGSGPYSPTAKYVERMTPVQAAAYTANWLRKNQPSILAARGQSAAAQVAAIENSGWAESHYGHEPAPAFLSAG